ncbi:NAD(P)-binding domain-containing protein [bacterium]|nr:NAD(P)-binding domain-containing protein [bacterium]
MKTIGFVGGGRIVRIMLAAWAKANAMPVRVVVSDADEQVLSRLKQQFPSIETAGADNLKPAAQDVVIVAVHPPVLKAALGPLAPAIKPDAIVLSLASTFTIAALSGMLGGFARIARMIPNAASVAGAGCNPLAFAAALGAADRDALATLLAPLGACPVVPEEKLECYAVVTAMSLTFFWYQMAQLAAVGRATGMSAHEARDAVARMAQGAGAVFADEALSEDDILDLIPVKPFAAMEAQMAEAYRTTLSAMFEKIKP